MCLAVFYAYKFSSTSRIFKERKNYSAHTIRAYGEDILAFQDFLNLNHEGVSLEDATYPIIRTWIVMLADGKMATVSINRKMASLKSFYKFLLKTKQISINPFLKHKSLKTAKKFKFPFQKQK